MANYQKRTKEEIEHEVKMMTDQTLTFVEEHMNNLEDKLEFFQFMDRFHEYSFRNQVLIQTQFEGAKAVGSFAFFKKMGFSVKKGEKGIRILKPNVFEYINADGKRIPVNKATKEQQEKLKTGELKKHSIQTFSPTTVFDITQTNAKPEDYPRLFPNKRFEFTVSNATNLSSLKSALTKVSTNMGVPVHTPASSIFGIRELGAAKGLFAVGKDGHKEIVLNPRNTPSEEVATLIHELAHAQLHDTTRVQEAGSYWSTKDVTELQVSIKELQAEMVSYVVSSHYGIDTKEHAIPYIAAWTNNGQEFYGETPEEQVAIMGGIQKTCKGFIQQLDQYYEKEQSATKENKQSQEVVTIRKTKSTSNEKNVVKGFSR
ncbi:ImmA/IrrE family metallo-endopeptidase [Enterococcus faecalis]|nr:ImmA/IrrE family metallo-endopeptidase [Enterococcus faecalis]